MTWEIERLDYQNSEELREGERDRGKGQGWMSPVASPAVRHIEWLSKQPACTVSVDYTTRIARSAPLTAHFFSFVPGSSWSQGRKGPWEERGESHLQERDSMARKCCQ